MGGKSAPDGSPHVPEQAADIFQQGALVLMVCLTGQALAGFMLCAEQPAAAQDLSSWHTAQEWMCKAVFDSSA